MEYVNGWLGINYICTKMRNICSFAISFNKNGALAQLARALQWHCRGHRFDSVMLHQKKAKLRFGFFCSFQPFGLALAAQVLQSALSPYL
jgi:hypothetical protein